MSQPSEKKRVRDNPYTNPRSSIEPDIPVLAFKPNDPRNPVNWSTVSFILLGCRLWLTSGIKRKRALVVVVGLLCIFNSVFGTSLPSGEINLVSVHFQVFGQVELVLPITIYQVGFMVGSVTWGPVE